MLIGLNGIGCIPGMDGVKIFVSGMPLKNQDTMIAADGLKTGRPFVRPGKLILAQGNLTQIKEW